MSETVRVSGGEYKLQHYRVPFHIAKLLSTSLSLKIQLSNKSNVSTIIHIKHVMFLYVVLGLQAEAETFQYSFGFFFLD